MNLLQETMDAIIESGHTMYDVAYYNVHPGYTYYSGRREENGPLKTVYTQEGFEFYCTTYTGSQIPDFNSVVFIDGGWIEAVPDTDTTNWELVFVYREKPKQIT